MRFVSAEEIHRVLTFPALVAAMEASHRRPRIAIRDLVMGEERAHYFVRSAVDAGRVLGSKLFTSFPDNLVAGARGEPGLPAVQGVYVLFDGTNGRPQSSARWHRDHLVEDVRRLGSRGPVTRA